MSCIRFNTETMRNQFSFADCDAEPVASFLSPPVTQLRIDRVTRMSEDYNPAVRAAAAASNLATDEVLERLSKDAYDAVREWVARNQHTSPAVLTALLSDKSERVVGHTILNRNTPSEAIDAVSNDSELIQSILRWRTEQAA